MALDHRRDEALAIGLDRHVAGDRVRAVDLLAEASSRSARRAARTGTAPAPASAAASCAPRPELAPADDDDVAIELLRHVTRSSP